MKKENRTINFLDPAKLRIVDEPYKDGRATPVSKYETIFSELKPNQRLVCPNGSASRLAAQLRNWLEKKGHKEPIVRARERCDDGQGGVWWIKEAEKPKTVWRGLEKKAA